MGIDLHPAWLGWDTAAGDGGYVVWAPGCPSASMETAMQSDPFIDFHRTAEAAGYPAMLVVSLVALAVVVLPVMLLALTRGVWALVLAVLSIFVALGLLAGAFEAAVADADDPHARG
jgi:cytochrome bd-type quinol oxidase subunit 2